jgi:hypothetical protein
VKICTAWINDGDARTTVAQGMMMRSVLGLGLEPVIFEGFPRPLLSEMLTKTRAISTAPAFLWVNSDCVFSPVLVRSTLDRMIEADCVWGFRRVESDGSGICGGVDAYLFPMHLWDSIYADDVPKMYVGGTHVDWWLTRAAQKAERYREAVMLIHESHARSETSKGTDVSGQQNLINYNSWADRHSISKC